MQIVLHLASKLVHQTVLPKLQHASQWVLGRVGESLTPTTLRHLMSTPQACVLRATSKHPPLNHPIPNPPYVTPNT